MTENFPNLAKKKDTQVQEQQGVPNKMNPKRPTPRHIIINMAKLKTRMKLKCHKRKGVSYLQRSSHKLSADLSKETL